MFGNVPLATLLQRSTYVHTTPTNTLIYAVQEAVGRGDIETVVQAAHNRCRSLHVDFVPGSDDAADEVNVPPSSKRRWTL